MAEQDEFTSTEQQALTTLSKPIPQRRFGSRVTMQEQEQVLSERQQAQQTLRQIAEARRQKQIQNQTAPVRNEYQDWETARKLYNRGIQPFQIRDKSIKNKLKKYYEAEAEARKQQQEAKQEEPRPQYPQSSMYEEEKPSGIEIEKILGTRLTPEAKKVRSILGADKPAITSVVVDSVKDTTTGQNIPITEFRVYEPTETGTVYRKASKSEIEQGREYEKAVTGSTDKPGKLETFKRKQIEKTGIVQIKQTFVENISAETIPISKDITNYVKKQNKYAGAFIGKVLPQTPGELAVDIGILTLGAGVGAGIGFGGVAVGKIGRYAPAYVEPISIGAKTIGGVLLFQEGQRTTERLTGYRFDTLVSKPYKTKTITSVDFAGELGSVTKDLTLFGGGYYIGNKGSKKILGYYSTRDRIFVDLKYIEAPERAYQKYPEISKGETAGQLKQEFKQANIKLGEITIKERGFSAQPLPLKNTIDQGKIRKNELVGLWSAPDLNPEFLRQAGGYKLFSTDVLDTTIPRIYRTEYRKKIEFAPGIYSGTKAPKKPKVDLIKFSFKYAGSGRTVLPFKKKEKEVASLVGSGIVELDKKYYTKVKGVRVPLNRIEIVENKEYVRGGKVLTKKNVEDYYSYAPSRTSLINPITLYYPSRSSGNKARSSLTYKTYSSLSFSSQISKIGRSTTSKINKSSITSKINRSSVKSLSYTSIGKPPRSPYIPFTPRRPGKQFIKPRLDFKRKTPGIKLSLGFRSFIVRGRKKLYISGILPKGEALSKGQQRALRTLSATFGVEPTNQYIKQDRTTFTPNTEIFRSYRISKGKRIPLIDTFIQKRGKRLVSKGERLEIQQARLR